MEWGYFVAVFDEDGVPATDIVGLRFELFATTIEFASPFIDDFLHRFILHSCQRTRSINFCLPWLFRS